MSGCLGSTWGSRFHQCGIWSEHLTFYGAAAGLVARAWRAGPGLPLTGGSMSLSLLCFVSLSLVPQTKILLRGF